MATIRDIAELAGVSVATVSRVINNKKGVTLSTKRKVQQVIKDLNYKVDPIAVSLNNKRSRTIGLIMPDITNPYFPELAKVIEKEAMAKGYNLIICNSDNDERLEKKQISLLEQKYIDGLIIASDLFEKSYLQRDIPVVVIDRITNHEFSTVTVDNYNGAIEATEHLVNTGCKRIAHISGPPSVKTAQERLKGYREVVQKESWFNESFIVNGEYNLDKAFNVTKDLLKNNSEIDGIFAGNDLMGVGVLKLLYSLEKLVPDEISVIGFDGIAFSKITNPELSTIAQPIKQIALEATTILFNLIVDKHSNVFHKKLKTTFRQGESTKH